MTAQLDDISGGGQFLLSIRKRCDKPVVGGINGVAVGAGLGLAMATDVRLISSNARLMAGYTRIGGSPRATLGLVAAARALALINGRDYVLPTDVQAVAKDVMAHRIVLGFDAVADNISTADVVDRILAMVPAPTPVWSEQQRQVAHEQHAHQPGRS